MRLDITANDIPRELRAKACAAWLPALCQFCSTGYESDGELLGHLEGCVPCQNVIDWAFDQRISDLHKLGRALLPQYRVRYQYGIGKPIYTMVHSISEGLLVAQSLRDLTVHLQSSKAIAGASITILIEPESLSRIDRALAPLRTGVIEA